MDMLEAEFRAAGNPPLPGAGLGCP